MTTPDPRRVTTFRPGWLKRRVATSVALLDSLPPKLRASLAQPTTRRRHHMTTTYPTSAADRQAQRARIRREILARAEAEAAKYGRSLKCAGDPMIYLDPRHAGEPGGCANGGSTCCCECHDPKETP